MQNNLAWDTTLGDPRVIIGITDDGNDTEHQDLYLNIWVNQNEIPATRRANLTDLNSDGYISMEELNDPVNQGAFKINDANADGRISALDLRAAMIKDGGGNDTGAGGWSDALDQGANGFVDDITGRDFWQTPAGDNDPRNDGGDTHGTHVAGIAAGRTNNGVGIAGTAGRATIMPIKFYGSSGNTWTSTIISNAYHYGTDNGAKIISTSYNVDSFANDNIFRATLNYMYDHGVLHFNSAGNNSQLNPARQKFDQSLYVVSTDSGDIKSSFSNYGWGVDISAPGTNILSTYPNNADQTISGTSMATPNAAGVAALIWSAHPTWTREQVAAQLLAAADNIDALNTPSLAGLLGSGRANSFKGINNTIAPPRVKSLLGLPAEGATTLTKPNSFTLDVGSIFDPATVNAGTFEMRGDGIDGAFGTGDDVLIPMTLVFGGDNAPDYKLGTNRLFFTIPGPMGSDTYRFSMLATARNPFGQALDGNGDGTAGDAFTRSFTITGLTNPYRVLVDPGEVVANAHFGNHDVAAPKVLASSFDFASAQSLGFSFNEDVSGSLSLADLVVTNLTTNQPVDTSGFTLAYNAGTNIATFSVNGILDDGNYRATLAAAGVTDPSGNLLDGNGNGVGGDDHNLAYFFLQGDANHDRAVDLLDFNTLAANFGQSSRDFTQGDFNYSSNVDLIDFNILSQRFGNTLAAGPEAQVVQRKVSLPDAPRVTTTRTGSGTASALFGATRIGTLHAPGTDSILTVLLDDRSGRLLIA
jgi:subtilisin family serine protease